MRTKDYAFIVENEVFKIYQMDDGAPRSSETHEGFLNNPIGMNVTRFQDADNGWIWNGITFIPGEDEPSSKTFFERTGSNHPENAEAYAFLSNNKIFFLMFVHNGISISAMYRAAFASSPTAVYIPEHCENVSLGDIWNGTTFIKGKD